MVSINGVSPSTHPVMVHRSSTYICPYYCKLTSVRYQELSRHNDDDLLTALFNALLHRAGARPWVLQWRIWEGPPPISESGCLDLPQKIL